MTEPAVFDDAALFAGDVVPAAKGISTTNAEAVIKGLIAAGRILPFAMSQNLTSAYQTWAIELHQFEYPDLIAAVHVWNQSEGKDFPTTAEMAAVTRGIIADRERLSRGTDKCLRCDDLHFIEVPPDLDGSKGMSPCPTCNPLRYEWVRDGHNKFSHNKAACGHDLCKPRHGRSGWRA